MSFVPLTGQGSDAYPHQRGIHDINRAFRFTSNPGFIFHDSPGFEAGGDHELKEAQSFIAKRAKSTEVGEQLHVVWWVVLFVCSHR